MSAETPMFRVEYTEQDVVERIRDVLFDPEDSDFEDASLIATCATFISSPVLVDISKAMVCLDLVRAQTLRDLYNGAQHLALDMDRVTVWDYIADFAAEHGIDLGGDA